MYDLQWISKNTARHYPIDDSASYVSQQNISFPSSLLLDIRITLTPYVDIKNIQNCFYVKSIQQVVAGFRLVIGCKYLSNDFQCFSIQNIPANINISTSMSNRQVGFNLLQSKIPAQYIAQFRRISGYAYIGITQDANIKTGTYTYQAAKINPICVLRQAKVIDSFLVDGIKAQGDIQLVAGQGILITTEKQVTAVDTYVTKITIAVDQAYIDKKLQGLSYQIQKYIPQDFKPIKTINNTAPDTTGNINIVGLDCVQVTKSSDMKNALVISNSCAKPCCQVQNSSTLKTQLDLLKSQQKILRDYFVQQSSNINYIQGNLATLIDK